MTLKETCELICILKCENETNTESEREFNNKWIEHLKKAMTTAIDKAYPPYQAKPDNSTTKRNQPTNRQ